MKHNFTISILLLITIFLSCKKDVLTSQEAALKTVAKSSMDSATINPNLKPFVVQPNYTYVDMELDPRPAGQNYDTYHATFGGIPLTISSLYWDSTTYPNLVNGVPAYGTVSLSNPSVTVFLNPASGNGIGGAQYTIAEALGTGFTSPKLPDDIQKYENALNPDTIKKLNYIPSLDDYVKGDYGGNFNTPLRITNIKIIRCTTGTHFGVASASYPFPAPTPANTNIAEFAFVYPVGSNYEYDVTVRNGYILGIKGYDRGTYQSFNILSFSGGSYSVNGSSYNLYNQNIAGDHGSFTYTGTGSSNDIN